MNWDQHCNNIAEMVNDTFTKYSNNDVFENITIRKTLKKIPKFDCIEAFKNKQKREAIMTYRIIKTYKHLIWSDFVENFICLCVSFKCKVGEQQ